MSYIQATSDQLKNLGFSKEREFLLVNNNGAYCSSTISTCNTRKYHGLLAAPQPQLDADLHVLLSNLDETIMINDKGHDLAVHQYPEVHYPEGHLLIENFSMEKVPEWTFEVAGVMFKKEILLSKKENAVMIRYQVVEADEKFKLILKPFIAYRNIHSVRNTEANLKAENEVIPNGIRFRMHNEYSPLHLQLSRKGEFIDAPDWYYNVEYQKEQARGYEFHESLFVPGYFEATLKKGDILILRAGTKEANSKTLKRVYDKEKAQYAPLNSFEACLKNAADQFIVTTTDQRTDIIAGWPWFGRWGRDTFIALPGLTLANDKPELFEEVVNSMMKDFKDGLFPNTGHGEQAQYNTIDAPLWFLWALQQYAYATGDLKKVWKLYRTPIQSILDNYRKGTLYNTRMLDNGLLWAGDSQHAVTWMDAIVDGQPVTPRDGVAVEINALWYNAVNFSLELSEEAGNLQFFNQWREYPLMIQHSFEETFWDVEKGYLADYVNETHKDWSVRPNQLLAISLPFSLVNDNIKRAVLNTVKKQLLTSRGLRSLAPEDPKYQGNYGGDHASRDRAYHQGIVWPWLTGHFVEASLRVKGNEALEVVESIYRKFKPAIFEYGLGTLCEIYTGDEPHRPEGAVSQAWSVAELLRTRQLINQYKEDHPSLANKKINKNTRKKTIQL